MFQRTDQFLHCRAYLHGLLEAPKRKNLEAVALAASAGMAVDANLPQALQHFISNSPWDYRRFTARLRELTRTPRDDPKAVWVIHDGVFVKKGGHSVGVHRQFARSLGRKINCQIGVILAQIGPNGYFPLAARLYVPGAWLREHEDAARRQIPEPDRVLQSRWQIALTLLEEVRDGGELVRPVCAEGGYTTTSDFGDALPQRGFTSASPVGEAIPVALRQFNRIQAEFGLDHFAGRNWHGWHHHVALVFAAYHFATIRRAMGS